MLERIKHSKSHQPSPEPFEQGRISELQGVAVPKDLADNISLALRLQDKIDDALVAKHRPGFLEMVRVMNCRKSVDAVRGKSVKTLVNKKPSREGLTKREVSDELSGIPALMKDVEAVLESGAMPVVGVQEDLQIASHLDEYELPAVVHVFSIEKERGGGIFSKLVSVTDPLTAEDCKKFLHRNHTFLVLGKRDDGEYLCFHKQGSELHHRFELRPLSSIERTAIHPTDDRYYLSFIHPATVHD